MTGVRPAELAPRQVEQEFRGLIEDGFAIKPAGAAKRKPLSLLSMGYTPKHKLELFDATFYLTNLRRGENFRFFVVYVLLAGTRSLYPRLFYKDTSLVWRSPSHYIQLEGDVWIGKGDLKWIPEGNEEAEYTAEETTNLPLEIQFALDLASRRGPTPRRDRRALDLVLRRAPEGRYRPYADFSEPRRKAMRDPRNQINRGEFIADFKRTDDPRSLRFVSGFEPDFRKGILEVDEMKSRIYGGLIRKYRILSRNRKIQYGFTAGPNQVWIIPPQTLTTELSSFGVRTVDVNAAEDLCIPGFEYHFVDDSEDPPQLFSQIPDGFAGKPSEVEPTRCDASPWLDQIPVIQEFRRFNP